LLKNKQKQRKQIKSAIKLFLSINGKLIIKSSHK
jgi:hypothetical protein